MIVLIVYNLLNLVWIEQESQELIGKHKILQSSQKEAIASLCLSDSTLLPQGDPIRFTSYCNLPFSWTSCEVRNILTMHKKRITFFALHLINRDLKRVTEYKMRRHFNKL